MDGSLHEVVVADGLSLGGEEGGTCCKSLRVSDLNQRNKTQREENRKDKGGVVLTDGGDVRRARGVLRLKGSAGLESVSDIGGSSVSAGNNDGKTKGSELLELHINALSPGERGSSFVTSIRDTVDKRA